MLQLTPLGKASEGCEKNPRDDGPAQSFFQKLMSNHASYGVASTWLNTPEAARNLGISETTLRRLRDRDGGLELGLHYKRGLFRNTPCRWNVAEIERFIEANAYSTPAKRGEQ